MRQAGRWDPEFQRIRTCSRQIVLRILRGCRECREGYPTRPHGGSASTASFSSTTSPRCRSRWACRSLLKPERPVPCSDRPIRTMQDLDRLNANPDPSTYSHTSATAVEAGEARIFCGGTPRARLRQLAAPFYGGHLLHRHQEGCWRPHASSPRSNPPCGTVCSTNSRSPPSAFSIR